jgi:hypothetical protein
MKVGDLVRFIYTDGPGSDIGIVVKLDQRYLPDVEVMWLAGRVYTESIHTLKVVEKELQ